MKIVQHAMPRSGSTLVLQVLLRLFDEEDIKYTHDFIETDKDLIITYRDFKDVLASHWRIWYAKLDVDKIINKPTYKEIKNMIGTVKNRVSTLNKYSKNYKGYDRVLWLKYEDFFDNYDFLFEKLEAFFSMRISEEKRKQIIEETNLELKKKQQKKIPIKKTDRIFDNYEDEKDIHANHIHPTIKPVKGYWKKVIPEEFHQMINYALEEDLKEWRYWDE